MLEMKKSRRANTHIFGWSFGHKFRDFILNSVVVVVPWYLLSCRTCFLLDCCFDFADLSISFNWIFIVDFQLQHVRGADTCGDRPISPFGTQYKILMTNHYIFGQMKQLPRVYIVDCTCECACSGICQRQSLNSLTHYITFHMLIKLNYA